MINLFLHVDGSYYIRSKFGNGNFQYASWYYNCAGSESSLLSCPYYTFYTCYNGHIAGVKCFSTCKRIYRHNAQVYCY